MVTISLKSQLSSNSVNHNKEKVYLHTASAYYYGEDDGTVE